MIHRKCLVLAAAAALFGCGDAPDETKGGPAKPPVGSKPKQGIPPNAVGGFSIQVPAMTLEPGEERTPCFVFPLELEGPSRFVAAASVTTTEGLHHGNLTSRPKTGEGIRSCDGENGAGLLGGEAGDILAGGAVLFGSSTQLVGTEWRRFPEGQAYRIKDGFEIVARMHYLNTTTKALTVAPEYSWHTIPQSDVTQEIAPFIWVMRGFEIPPKSEYSMESECWLPEPMKIVDAMPHMHALGSRFFGSYVGGELDGQNFLNVEGFDEASDIFSYDPAVDLSQGNGFRFGCTWKNTFNKTIVEGIGDNEMCMMFGYSYPVTSAYNVVASSDYCLPGPSPNPAADD